MVHFWLQGTQVSTSRRLCLTCICSSLALISSAGTAVSLPNAMAMDEKEKAVCRNCGGSGAVLCECHFYIFFHTYSTTLLNGLTK